MEQTLTIHLDKYEREFLRRYLEKVEGSEKNADVSEDESQAAQNLYSILE